MADSQMRLADARQRVAMLEKEERLLKLQREQNELALKARRLKEEVEKAEEELHNERSRMSQAVAHATVDDSVIAEPPKK